MADEILGPVRIRPVESFDRLAMVLEENPGEVVPQAKAFLQNRNPDPLVRAATCNLISYALTCRLRRNYHEALGYSQQAIDLVDHLDDQWLAKFDYRYNGGLAAFEAGLYQQALIWWDECWRMLPLAYQRMGMEYQLHADRGLAWYFLGRYDDALAAYSRAETAIKPEETHLYEDLRCREAHVYLRQERLLDAATAFAGAAETHNWETAYSLMNKAGILTGAATLHVLQKDYAEASRFAGRAAQIAEQAGDVPGLAEARIIQAICAHHLGFPEEVQSLAAKAFTLAFNSQRQPLIDEICWLATFICGWKGDANHA